MIKKYTFHSLLLTLLFICLLCCRAVASDLAYCDSIIKKGIDSMLDKKFVPALQLLGEAQAKAKESHWYKEEFLATNNIGLTYYFMLDYGEALNYYLVAYTIALKQDQPIQEMTVLNNIAILYSKEKNFDKANDYFTKAYEIAKDKKEFFRIGIYAANLGIVYNQMHEPKKARNYIDEALQYFEKEPLRLLGAKVTLAQNYLEEQNLKEAKTLGEQLLVTAKDSGYKDEQVELLVLLANVNLKENNTDKAIAYANQALTDNHDLESTAEIYTLLADIYKKNQSYALSIQFKDSVIRLQDSINKIKNGRVFENSKLKFELLNSQHSLALNQSTLSSQRKILYAALILFALLATFVIWVIRNNAIKNKQKEMITERSRKIIALEFENEKRDKLLLEKQLKEKETIALLEQEKLKNEIELKNRKLTAKALYLSGRNGLIEEIITAIAKMPDLPKDSNLVKQIVNLKNHMKADVEWDNFSTHFEEVNQGFLTALKNNHPSLTANDIRFCSYIYMNLTTKEIASLLNITAEGCRKRKERIAKKMELKNEVSLYDYLSAL